MGQQAYRKQAEELQGLPGNWAKGQKGYNGYRATWDTGKQGYRATGKTGQLANRATGQPQGHGIIGPCRKTERRAENTASEGGREEDGKENRLRRKNLRIKGY